MENCENCGKEMKEQKDKFPIYVCSECTGQNIKKFNNLTK